MSVNETVYCAVNKEGEVQWVKGSSSKTRYFKTDKYLRKAVAYHNKCHEDDKWFVSVCALNEVKRYVPVDNIDVITFGGVLR